MSEYQLYDFVSVNRALTRRERDALQKLAPRAEITERRFTVVDDADAFEGDPIDLLDRHFDAFVHLGPDGSIGLGLRLPAGELDEALIESCIDDEWFVWETTDAHDLLAWWTPEGVGHWEDDEESIERLVELRRELARGDHRALYLGWLHAWSQGADAPDTDADDIYEPRIDRSLAVLTPALEVLVDALGLDADLLAAAARQSEHREPRTLRELLDAAARDPGARAA